jgi:glycosyltransferase involved in cell wall biosynthesis
VSDRALLHYRMTASTDPRVTSAGEKPAGAAQSRDAALRAGRETLEGGMRIAFCLSHPIQYRVPLLRVLAQDPRVSRVKAFFYCRTGLMTRPDRRHGTAVKWDVPLLEGYEHEFLSARRSAGAHSFSVRLVPALRREAWDAVVIQSYLYPNDWLAWLVAKRARIPALFYGEMYPRPAANRTVAALKNLPKRVMLGGDTICLAIGSGARQVFLDMGIPENRIHLAPYAVDNQFFMAQHEQLKGQKVALKAELGVSPEDPVVLCVAGMRPEKRQEDLVEAMARLSSGGRLVLVGHGPRLEEIRALCRSRLPSAVLTGFKNQSELPRLYAAADVFVLPSKTDAFGLVVNEAMCFALPVLASTGVAAARDLVVDGENGFTFRPGDVEALSVRLGTLLADSNLRERFGLRSREIVVHWDYRRAADAILAAVESRRRRERTSHARV